MKNADFDQYLVITSEPYELAKSLIWSQPRAFQRAIDEVRKLPLILQKAAKKRICRFCE